MGLEHGLGGRDLSQCFNVCGQRVEGRESALCPALLRPLEPCVQPWALQHRKDLELSEQGQEAPAMMAGLEQLCCAERLRELGVLSLEKRRLQGDLTVPF